MAVPQRSNPLLRAFRPLFAFLLMMGVLGFAFTWYAAPDPELDWDRADLPSIAEKAMEMIANQRLSANVTEEELDAIVKEALMERRNLGNGWEMTGAKTTLSGDTMTLVTDLALEGRLRVQLTHQFQLQWESPNIVATHVSTALKDIPLPSSWFSVPVIRVPLVLDERIPAEVSRVAFEEGGIRLDFKLLLSNPFF